jgi:hypothetical protein
MPPQFPAQYPRTKLKPEPTPILCSTLTGPQCPSGQVCSDISSSASEQGDGFYVCLGQECTRQRPQEPDPCPSGQVCVWKVMRRGGPWRETDVGSKRQLCLEESTCTPSGYPEHYCRCPKDWTCISSIMEAGTFCSHNSLDWGGILPDVCDDRRNNPRC